MKIRESGMPEESYWESFFDIPLILTELKIDSSIIDVAEFGSGYGTFTIPTAKRISGNLHAFDIETAMIERLKMRISDGNISNIKVYSKDFLHNGTGLDDSSVGYAMLFNILHTENPIELLNEAFRILKPGGLIGIIHWIHSSITPRGPSLEIRPTPLQCADWLLAVNFKIIKKNIALPPFHYGIIGIKV